MADPLGRAVAGTPFRPSAGAWNRMLDAARAADSGAGNPSGLDVPHCLVRVRNDTGGDLAAFSVLALGASILDITVPLRVSPTPMFEGTTPAATTDAFAVLIEPAPDGKFALAAIAGVVPVEINVTDAGHGYATPTAASAARLTSAASGPARILDRESGTGNVSAVVSLGGQSAAAFSGARVYNSSTQSFTSGVAANLAFPSERFDTDGYHDGATDNGRITFAAAGYYLIGATAWWDAADRFTFNRLALNFRDVSAAGGAGATFTIAIQEHSHDTTAVNMNMAQSVSTLFQCEAGDYCEVQVLHITADGATAIVLGSTGSAGHAGAEFWATKLG